MQKQEKLVSHLNNNEFVHNNNKSLFLAKKKPQACALKDLYELFKHFDSSPLLGMNFNCHDYNLQIIYDDLKIFI